MKGERIEAAASRVSGDRQAGGPYDVVGDVHGCRAELEELLRRLGYDGAFDTRSWTNGGGNPPSVAPRHPAGRTAIFVGDLTDRGPDSAGTVRLIHRMWRSGLAIVTPGNHDDKLLRYLRGHNVRLRHGIETTVAEYEALPPDDQRAFFLAVEEMVGGAPPYLILDEGGLVVAHAGIKEWMIGQRTPQIRVFTLYGDVAGQTLEGLPIRRDWAAGYRGKPLVVYGHTAVERAELRNNTINVDTGCVYGGWLTAFRYPEREIVQVRAKKEYWPQSGIGR